MPDHEQATSIAKDIVKTMTENDSEMRHFVDGYFTSHQTFTNKDFKAIVARYAKKEGL